MVSRKRVARVMRTASVAGVSRRRTPRTTRRDSQARPAPDRVNRCFEADAPNRLWLADITYVPTRAGFSYLAVVLDVFSRRVVGWAMAPQLRTALVQNKVEAAYALSDLFERRRRLMDDWAAYLAGTRGQVILYAGDRSS